MAEWEPFSLLEVFPAQDKLAEVSMYNSGGFQSSLTHQTSVAE